MNTTHGSVFGTSPAMNLGRPTAETSPFAGVPATPLLADHDPAPSQRVDSSRYLAEATSDALRQAGNKAFMEISDKLIATSTELEVTK